MTPIEKLVAAESIRNTKAMYWYALDMKDWNMLRSIFADDCVADFREERASALRQPVGKLPSLEESLANGDSAVGVGGKNVADLVRMAVEHWTTVHHGHAPIIEIHSSNHATGIWPLFDYISDGTHTLKGYGHYHEEYVPDANGRWLISRLRLTRIRSDGVHPWSAQ